MRDRDRKKKLGFAKLRQMKKGKKGARMSSAENDRMHRNTCAKWARTLPRKGYSARKHRTSPGALAKRCQ